MASSLSEKGAAIFTTLKKCLTGYWECCYNKNKKEERNAGSNPDLSYPNLSPLPLHYHTDHQDSEKKLANSLSWLFTSITGDPSPFHNFYNV